MLIDKGPDSCKTAMLRSLLTEHGTFTHAGYLIGSWWCYKSTNENKKVVCIYSAKALVTQYNKRYILCTFEKIEIFVLSNWRFNKISNNTKFIKLEGIILKIQVLQSVNFLLFSLYLTLFCSLSQNEAGRQDVPFVVLGHI